MNEKIPSEEIDLLIILRSIKRGFLNVFLYIQELISLSFRNKKTLLAFIIVGVGIGAGLFFIKKPVFASSLTLSHTRIDNIQCADLVNSLSKIPNMDSVLSKKLKIDIKTAKEIKSIAYKSLNKIEENDSLLKLADFKIEVQVYNPSILDSLQKKILMFLESNEYATKRKEINKLYLDRIEEKLKSEIIAVDSLKHIVDKSILPRSMGNGIILGESVDPVKVYQEGMKLYQSQLEINQAKELNNSFEIIVGFSPAIPTSSLIFNVLVGFILSLLSGIVWIKNKKV